MKNIYTVLIAMILVIPGTILLISIDNGIEGTLVNEYNLTLRDTITISRDSDFTSSNGVTSGSGSLSDPYIIENFKVYAAEENGIQISETSDYFMIRNCWIIGNQDQDESWLSGIELSNVENGLIQNCKFENLGKGVHGTSSSYIMIHNNTVNNNGDGIGFYSQSHHITTTNNSCYLNGMAIQIRFDVDHCFIANNSCIRSSGSGIDVRSGSDNNIVEYNECLETYEDYHNDMNGAGIVVTDDSNNNRISHNNCSGNSGRGIVISHSDDNRIIDNTMIRNRAVMDKMNRYGLYITRSNRNIFEDNVMIDCGIYFSGEDLEANLSSTNSIDGSNTVNGKSITYQVGSTTYEVFSGDIGPLILLKCENKVIEDLNIDGIPSFINIQHCTNIKIKNNHFNNVALGINAISSEDLEITMNSIENFREAMNMEKSYDSLISNNTLINGNFGIKGWPISTSDIEYNSLTDVTEPISTGGSRNCIKMNVVTNGRIGILTDSDNRIYHNIVDSFSEYGIFIHEGGNHVDGNLIIGCDIGLHIQLRTSAMVENNMISYNRIGIQSHYDLREDTIRSNNISFNSEYGIDLSSQDAQGISIYHNSFYMNNGGGIQARDRSQKCTWDDGSFKGNYWSDYESRYVPPASNNNSTWNMTYIVDGGSSKGDKYPLIGSLTKFDPVLRISKNHQLDAQIDTEYNVSYKGIYSGDMADISWSFSTNASWLVFDDLHFLFGTPVLSDTGEYWVNISITDGVLEDHVNFTILVGIKNYPPVITTSDVLSVDQWSQYRVDYNASDDQVNLEWQLTTEAKFLTIDSQSGILSGTPGLNDVGVHLVNVSVNDGELWDITHFNLKVIDVNDPPMMNSSISYISMDEDTTVSYPLSDLFFNYDDDPLEILITSSSMINSTIRNSSFLEISTEENWHGTGSLKFSVSDGTYNLSFNINVIVRSINDPPMELDIILDELDLVVGGNQIVTANFLDPDVGDYASVSWYIDGVLVSNETSFNLTLDEGNYSLTLRVTDSEGEYSEKTIVLNVSRRGDDISSNPHPRDQEYTGIIIGSLIIILILIGMAFFLIRRRSSSHEPDKNAESPTISYGNIQGGSIDRFNSPVGPGMNMIENGLIDRREDDLGPEVPWFNGSDNEMEDLMVEAFENEHQKTHDTSGLLKKLKRKQKNGELLKEEYKLLKLQIDRIREE